MSVLLGPLIKSYEILIPRLKDQNILIIQNTLVLGKSLSCSCNGSIIFLALVSLGLGDTAIPWDMQDLLEEHRCGEKTLDPLVRLQNSHILCHHSRKLCVKIQTAWEVRMKQELLLLWQL